ncbi:MAG TPA: hypothetical protein VHN81_00935 [Edaphobacter sp.]|nr:hypothetical protein [Edaphobacter sp.]
MLRFRAFIALVMLAISFNLLAEDQTVEIHVRVINGKNGKPIRDEKLNVSTGENDANLMATNETGTIVLHIDSGARLGVISNLYVTCQPYKPGESWRFYSVDEIVSKGISQANTCSHIRVSAKPGELILFERPRTFWEGMRL